MSSLSLQPYVGNNNYIAFLCCNEDFSKAEKLISKPVLDGYRIWFDSSENGEYEKIAETEKAINECTACIAVLSRCALNSHYVRSSVTYAVNLGKPVIFLFIENTPLTIGLRLQVEANESIEKYTLSSDEYYNRLYGCSFIAGCRDTQADKAVTMWLERESTKDIIILKTGATTFGRLAEMCDYVIDNNKYVGRLHATIINSDRHCVIIDNDSKNKTYVNSRMLVPNEQFRLYDGDTVMIANEKFVYHQN